MGNHALAPWAQPGLRVLVIEDDPAQCAMLVALLCHSGVACVSQASCGRDALRILQEGKAEFDLTLCDLYMEGGDGIEFIRCAAGLPLGRLVLMSALDDDLVSAAALIAHSYGLCWGGRLEKPICPQALGELLERCASTPAQPMFRPPALAGEVLWDEAGLREGLERGEFVPFFQPKVDLATGEVAGAEMLARWRHPEHGLIGPANFMPSMECSGMVTEMMECLLEQALASLAEWRALGMPLTLRSMPRPSPWATSTPRNG